MFEESKKNDVSCYRPLRLLLFKSKVLERLIFNALHDHLKTKLQENHFRLERKRSAFLQMKMLTDKVFRSPHCNTNDAVAILHMDFSKHLDAFHDGN